MARLFNEPTRDLSNRGFFLDIVIYDLSNDCKIMKPRRAHPKKSAVIKHSRWVAYTAAGAASALASISTAEAEIHYSGLIHHEFTGYSVATFPLARGAILSFRHAPPYSYSTFTKFGGSGNFAVFGQGVASAAGFYTCAYNSSVASVSHLEQGDAISTRPFVPQGGILASGEGFGCGGGARGQFVAPGSGFIGFKFNNGNGDQYGWARVRAIGYPRNQFILTDYAYGDVGDPIRAGQRAGGRGPSVESLGGLALGAAGLLAWRRRNPKQSDAL